MIQNQMVTVIRMRTQTILRIVRTARRRPRGTRKSKSLDSQLSQSAPLPQLRQQRLLLFKRPLLRSLPQPHLFRRTMSLTFCPVPQRQRHQLSLQQAASLSCKAHQPLNPSSLKLPIQQVCSVACKWVSLNSPNSNQLHNRRTTCSLTCQSTQHSNNSQSLPSSNRQLHLVSVSCNNLHSQRLSPRQQIIIKMQEACSVECR